MDPVHLIEELITKAHPCMGACKFVWKYQISNTCQEIATQSVTYKTHLQGLCGLMMLICFILPNYLCIANCLSNLSPLESISQLSTRWIVFVLKYSPIFFFIKTLILKSSSFWKSLILSYTFENGELSLPKQFRICRNHEYPKWSEAKEWL